jgi:anthranilate synthase component 2
LKQILLVDNYDSFTYNLLHSLEKDPMVQVTVVRNNFLLNVNIDLFDKIVLSPGPGLPKDAGELMPFIKKCYLSKPILGVCLGHQALGEFFGAKLKNLSEVLHGIQLETKINNQSVVFKDLPFTILTGHYHSWVLSEVDFPTCLKITAHNIKGGIMAFEHCELNIFGIQFHPESVLTLEGDKIIQNWIKS